VDHLGKATPIGAALFAYAYYGLYVNACQLCNPFNYDKTLTGVPINAFIQRLDALTGAALLDCNEAYGVEEEAFLSPFSSIFKASAIEKQLFQKSPRTSPRHSSQPGSPRGGEGGRRNKSFTSSFAGDPDQAHEGVRSTSSTPGLGPVDASKILPQSPPSPLLGGGAHQRSPQPWLVGQLAHLDAGATSEPPSPLASPPSGVEGGSGRGRRSSGSRSGLSGQLAVSEGRGDLTPSAAASGPLARAQLSSGEKLGEKGRRISGLSDLDHGGVDHMAGASPASIHVSTHVTLAGRGGGN